MINREKRLLTYGLASIVIVSLFLIILVTLFPFVFVARDDFSLTTIIGFLFSRSNPLNDLIANVLLFVSLGFGLAGILQRGLPNQRVSLIIILIVSGSLSLSIEILQILLPLRSPRIVDVLANSLGSGFGAAFFYIWQHYFLRQFSIFWGQVKRFITPRKIALTALSYCAFVVYLFIALQQIYNFSNWDSSFPLLIGNELTGDRSWHGTISEVSLSGQSLNKQEISQVFTTQELEPQKQLPWLAAYQFEGNGNYSDQNRHLPDLVWQSDSPGIHHSGGILLNQQHWLKTQIPVTALTQAIQQASQFSLLTTVSTADIQQTGPARIVSISIDPYRRNLTMGQQGTNLVVRLRTPISGEGGDYPELVFPGIFVDTLPHRLLLTYHHHTLYLYVDEMEQSYLLELSPEILFFRLLSVFGISDFQINPISQQFLKVFFYGLMSFPLTVLLALYQFSKIW